MTRSLPRLTLRALAIGATLALLALFGWLNSHPGELPTQNVYPTLIGSQILSLILLSLPLLPGFLADPTRLNRWFALPAKRPLFYLRLLGGFLLLLLSTSALLEVMNPAEEQATVQLLAALSLDQLAVAALFLCVLTPLVEECLCRGILLETARPALALPLSAAFFALAHGLSAFLLPLFFMGWCLGLLTLRTRTLLPAILLHGAFNLFSLCLTAL